MLFFKAKLSYLLQEYISQLSWLYCYFTVFSDVNECETSKPCNMTCTNSMGSFKCDCPKGYEGDGMKNGTGCHLIVTHSRNLTLELCKYLRIVL